MVNFMISELKQFMITFGLVVVTFIIVGRQLNEEFKNEKSSFFQIILDIFDGVNGKQNYDDYKEPEGKAFITVFVYIFKILLLSFLVSMFINRYKFMWQNIDAIRRMEIIKLKNSKSYNELYGGVTITFFPISLIALPFLIPIILLKSERMNDFILKIQYSLMIVMFCIIAIILSIPLLPLLYIKCILNAIFISFNNKRETYKGQNTLMLLFTLTLNPPILIVSMVVDLLSLPNMLLMSEKGFEYKYQQSLETLTDVQVVVVMDTFAKIFYFDFFQKFGGKGMTLIELMIMHRKIFSLIDNLHDLICRGNKDHTEALEKVQDYNMTKILTRKCSIPDRSGDIKLARCDFNILYSLQMDVELYNYIDALMYNFRAGKLEDLVEKNKKAKDGLQSVEDNPMGFNAGLSFLPMTAQPPGVTFKRDNADFMNNFYVDITCRAFTNIEEIHKQATENTQLNKQNSALKELKDLNDLWNNDINGAVVHQLNNYDNAVIRKQQHDQEDEDNNWEALKKLANQKTQGSRSRGFGNATSMGGNTMHNNEEPMDMSYR